MNTIVRALITNGNKIFLVKRAEKAGFNQWQLPGGHIDYVKEFPTSALKRELREETNLKAVSFKKYKDMVNPITKKRTLIYHTQASNFDNIRLQRSELNGWGWFTKNEIKKMNVTNTTRRI